MDIKIDKHEQTGEDLVVISEADGLKATIIPRENEIGVEISFVSKYIVDVYHDTCYPQKVVLMLEREPVQADGGTMKFLYVNLLEKENESKQELLKQCYAEIEHKNKIIGHSNNKIGEIRKFKKSMLDKFKKIYGEPAAFVKGTAEQNDEFMSFVASVLKEVE